MKRLLLIPAYVIIFMGGSIAALMIFFTLPLILMLVLFDGIVLLCSSMLSVLHSSSISSTPRCRLTKSPPPASP